jgi:uncharacterized protein (TIGR03083 family)
VSGYLASDARVSDAYIALRSRVVDLVRSRRDSDGDLPVPHCPAWTARDLLAHLGGTPEDILAGRLEGVATDAWTHAQVERHRGESLAQLANAWMATSTGFDPVLSMIPAPVNSQLVLDVVTHEHDLRHALGAPGERGNDAVEVALGWVLHNADLASPGLPAQLLSYRLDAFDLLRVCTGRRSRAQILDLGLDVGVVELLLAKSPLSLPETAVRE